MHFLKDERNREKEARKGILANLEFFICIKFQVLRKVSGIGCSIIFDVGYVILDTLNGKLAFYHSPFLFLKLVGLFVTF